MKRDVSDVSRRGFLALLAGVPGMLLARGRWIGVSDAAAAATVLASSSAGASTPLPPTPDCGDDEPTPTTTAGPFYKPDSPLRNSLVESGMEGERIALTGIVFTRGCRPVAGALLDFWHADPNGAYDNAGFRLRGHQFADAEGRYRLETVVPGLYPGRTRHFHVRVQAPRGRILTTQLFFPGEPRNQTDFIFRPDLLMWTRSGSPGREAKFNFVLRAG